MSKVIIPIGFDAGPIRSVEPDTEGQLEGFEIVHHTWSTILPKEAYEVWFSTFLDPQAHADLAFTRDHLIKLANRDDAAHTVDRLLASGLLLEFEPDSESALDLLRNHKIFSSADGMGSTEERPGLYQIGKLGNELVEVRREVYSLWSGSFVRQTIWDAVLDSIKKLQPGATYTTPESLGHLFAKSIPMLLGLRAAHLQPVS